MQRIWRHKVTRYLIFGAVLCVCAYFSLWTSLQFQAVRKNGNVGRSMRNVMSAHSADTGSHSGIRILCWILVEERYLDSKGKAVKETWTKRCDKILFFSTTTNTSFPTIGLDIPQGRAHLTSKAMMALAYCYKLYRDDFDWFFKADDDTYVIVENLRMLLEQYNPEDPVYFGYRFKPYTPQGYMSGGAGYVLSKEALIRLMIDGVLGKRCDRISGVEDLDIGRCLAFVGVKAVDSLDEKGLETFHPLSVNSYFNDIFKFPSWLDTYAYHPVRRGYDCCSNRTISFHYMRPPDMYILEYLIYYLKH